MDNGAVATDRTADPGAPHRRNRRVGTRSAVTAEVALLLTGGLTLMFGLICCPGTIDVLRMVGSARTSARLGERRPAFVGYVILVVLIPEAATLFFGWLFVRVLFDW